MIGTQLVEIQIDARVKIGSTSLKMKKYLMKDTLRKCEKSQWDKIFVCLDSGSHRSDAH